MKVIHHWDQLAREPGVPEEEAAFAADKARLFWEKHQSIDTGTWLGLYDAVINHAGLRLPFLFFAHLLFWKDTTKRPIS